MRSICADILSDTQASPLFIARISDIVPLEGMRVGEILEQCCFFFAIDNKFIPNEN